MPALHYLLILRSGAKLSTSTIPVNRLSAAAASPRPGGRPPLRRCRSAPNSVSSAASFCTLADDVPDAARSTPRMETLKETVRRMLRSCATDRGALKMVDAVQRLGLSYHFPHEIDDVLRRIRSSQLPTAGGSNLFEVSLRFRLLRQSGFWVPEDVFDMFKDDAGKFDVNLRDDAEGLLSLYNAAYLKTPKDQETLDDAISSAQDSLRSMCSNLEEPLKGQVTRYLDVPLWRRMRRQETRYYISEYELELAATQGTPEYGDAYALLELAKLDFNRVQYLHRVELESVSRWWNDIHKDGKVGFARDHMHKGFVWALGMHHEPQWTRTRSNMMRLLQVAIILDDLADSHATPRELRTLNQAVQRWVVGETDAASVSLQPEYLGYVFELITSTFKNIEDTLKPEEKYRMVYLKQSLGVFCMAEYKELEMFSDGSMPSFNDHLDVSTITTAYPLLLTASVVSSSSEEITEDALRWLLSTPELVRCCAKILRFLNDICSRESEKDRSRTITTIRCYQDEQQVSWPEAVAAFLSFTEEAWAELNQAVVLGQSEEPKLRSSPTPVIAQLLIDYGRIAMLLYGSGVDRYTDEASEISSIVYPLLFEHFEISSDEVK